MDKDSSKRTDAGADSESIRRDRDTIDAGESLSEALSGLERILVARQRGKAEPRQRAPESAPRPAPVDAQYTIPMLQDVVVPGEDPAPAAAPGGNDGHRSEHGPEEEELCRRLTERLANEIEVIVQARVEAAVQEAAGDIREQVRNHLEIMLPEILEELNALGRRRRD